ncbi:response regulator [Nitrogeniibacter mangrovi]|uniref:Response regulator n=1 Tax=Nitrogeniibacter mangrovi TaxID=2016596 RepID=A0A6C1B669_9RHOO|nr:response regulator [Nitrogeniibacter mangrovi]QID18933.1 response regulator [Nitrogeniibacter mangrovi]
MTATLNVTELDTLIVEPSAMQARIIAQACTDLGLPAPRHASSTAEAIDTMLAQRPDLVISALYLPDGSGTELVRQMRAHPLLEAVAFILVSSETNPQALDPVRQSGICGIVPKPFSNAQLGRALDNTLDLLSAEALGGTDTPLEDLKVLVVDDSPNARRFIRRVLGNLGVEHFIEAGDGAEAMAIINDVMVDLVVTDYNMPEMDGRELVEHIRRQSWQRAVPILMVTSESDAGRLAAVQDAGVSGICDKPFEPATVRSLLARMLGAG